MVDESEYLQLLRRKAEQILGRSPRMESMPGLPAAPPDPAAPRAQHLESATLEAVVRWYRPVLVVTDDRFVVTDGQEGDPRFVDPNRAASQALLDELERKRSVLDPVIRSVGRIELTNNLRYPWVGTGWLLDCDLGSDIIVTNAHVGREFGMRSGENFVFQPGVPMPSVRQSARIDFREEVGLSSPREFPITDIIWISDRPDLDICLLRVARTAGVDRLDPPVRLMTNTIEDNRKVAVIGYPGSNNGYDPALFEKLFGSVTGNKRFSPGFYTGRRGNNVTYDCSTLPGSSGSVVLDVETGQAIGLHFAGTAFDSNYAVAAADVARLVANRPWQPELTRKPPAILGDAQADATGAPANDGGAHAPAPVTASAADGSITMVVPLEITVRLGSGAAVTTKPAATTKAPVARRTDASAAKAAAEKVRAHLLGDSSVLSVKADYLFRDGQITDEFGVVVGVGPGASTDPGGHALGDSVDGVPISVELADPQTIAEQQFAFNTESFSGRTARYERDLSDPRFDLSPVTGDMNILLHVSPEAGWPVLKTFLAEPGCDRLTIGMYHMTAPHVVEAIEAIAARERARITLTLDRQRGNAQNPDDTSGEKKANDIPERDTLAELERVAGTRFKWAPASLGGSALFASAYHIKVAVWSKSGRGGGDRIFWLSSGNWQSSNQAPIDKSIDEIGSVTQSEVDGYNREWHAVVQHAGLAATFRNHLEQDYEDDKKAAEEEAPLPTMPDVLVPIELVEEAPRPRRFEAFAPKTIQDRVKVQPLLTPDNYPEVIYDLISKAKDRLLIENQSFALWKDIDATPEHFLKIVKAVRQKQRDGLEVRIIFRSGFGNEREVLRRMKSFGLKVDSAHVRFFDKCHTKGIVVDDDVAVLGSQNWTASGTGPNRDASLVIWHPEANAYFAKLFEYDWNQLARNRVRSLEGVAPVRLVSARQEAPAPAGYRRISLAEFLGET